MHVGTGNLLPPEFNEVLKEQSRRSEHRRLRRELDNYIDMVLEPTERQLGRGRVGRNELCPCGSGKKFKKCCLKPS